ncbi:MAG: cellulose biosynthesis protein BcsP [Janthinobacterium lividum]
MTASEDISNLFRKFGGEEDGYQEIVKQDQASESRARWPLLSAVNLSDNAVAPAVNLPEGPAAPTAPMKAAPTLHAPAPATTAPAASGPFGPSSVQTEVASAQDSADIYVPGPDETALDGNGRVEPDLANSPDAPAARATTVMKNFRRPGTRAAKPAGSPLPARNPRDPRDALQRFAANPSAPRAGAGLRDARWARPAAGAAAQVGPGSTSQFASQPAVPAALQAGSQPASQSVARPAAVPPVSPPPATQGIWRATPPPVVHPAPAPRREGSLLGRMFANTSQAAAVPAPVEPPPVQGALAVPRDLSSVFTRLAGKPAAPAATEQPAATGASLSERLNRL